MIEDYPGGDIVLPGDRSRVIRVADNHDVEWLRGRTLITFQTSWTRAAAERFHVVVVGHAG